MDEETTTQEYIRDMPEIKPAANAITQDLRHQALTLTLFERITEGEKHKEITTQEQYGYIDLDKVTKIKGKKAKAELVMLAFYIPIVADEPTTEGEPLTC